MATYPMVDGASAYSLIESVKWGIEYDTPYPLRATLDSGEEDIHLDYWMRNPENLRRLADLIEEGPL